MDTVAHSIQTRNTYGRTQLGQQTNTHADTLDQLTSMHANLRYPKCSPPPHIRFLDPLRLQSNTQNKSEVQMHSTCDYPSIGALQWVGSIREGQGLR